MTKPEEQLPPICQEKGPQKILIGAEIASLTPSKVKGNKEESMAVDVIKNITTVE